MRLGGSLGCGPGEGCPAWSPDSGSPIGDGGGNAIKVCDLGMVGLLGDAGGWGGVSGQPSLLALLPHGFQAGWQMPSEPNWSKPSLLLSAQRIAPFYLPGPCHTLSAFLGGGLPVLVWVTAGVSVPLKAVFYGFHLQHFTM